MDGYGRSTYGDAFADVYDEWYQHVSDVDATVAFVSDCTARSDDRHVLELGVGTGRLAIPLAEAGLDVTGVDSSAMMLDRLATNDPDALVERVCGDMVDDLPPGPFGVVLVAYNTLFNLESAERQADLFAAVAARLAPRGRFVVEAFVPDDPAPQGSSVAIRTLTANRVVLLATVHDAATQRADGQFIEFSETGGVRLRPWSIRYASPEELDAMAGAAGLALLERFEDVHRVPFVGESPRHLSVYSLA